MQKCAFVPGRHSRKRSPGRIPTTTAATFVSWSYCFMELCVVAAVSVVFQLLHMRLVLPKSLPANTHTHSYRKAGSYFSLNHRFNLPFTSTSTAEWCYVVPLPALAQDMTGYSVDLHLCRCVYVCSV